MTRRMNNTAWLLVPVLMLATSGYRDALGEWPIRDASPVEITLWPNCTAIGDVVLMSHIARVSTTDEVQRSQIEALDIAEAPTGGKTTEVTSRLVGFRLQMAGIDPHRVAIRGSKTEVRGLLTSVRTAMSTTEPSDAKIRAAVHAPVESAVAAVRSDEQAPPATAPSGPVESANGRSVEEAIILEARRAILAQLPWPEQNLSIRPAQPIGREAQLVESKGFTCTAQIRSSGPPVGRVNVEVTVKCTGQDPVVVPIAFDVRHFEDVVATARAIARGHVIQKEDVYLYRWDVTGATDYSTKLEPLIGRAANRSLPALQILREQDLARGSADSGKEGPVVMKRQSRIKMTSRLGDLNITVNGEALQDGRVGESIRVQNIESKAIVQGRVLTADEVEVSY